MAGLGARRWSNNYTYRQLETPMRTAAGSLGGCEDTPLDFNMAPSRDQTSDHRQLWWTGAWRLLNDEKCWSIVASFLLEIQATLRKKSMLNSNLHPGFQIIFWYNLIHIHLWWWKIEAILHLDSIPGLKHTNGWLWTCHCVKDWPSPLRRQPHRVSV